MANLAHNLNFGGWHGKKSPEVLVLDDSEFDRTRLRRIMSNLPMALNVTEAEDLDVLSHHISSKSYDIILVDYELAKGDGLQALNRIRNSNLNHNAKTVMVTGYDSSSLAVNALKNGFDDYITKNEASIDVFLDLLTSCERQLETNVIPFPQKGLSEHEPIQISPDADFGANGLAQVLEPSIQTAVDKALARNRAEEIGESLVSIIASFQEADEFIFIDE